MRLVEAIVDLVPGESARCTRTTRPDDWFFQGHFPGNPVVPAIVLVELLAQTGGLAAGAPLAGLEARPLALRVAALGPFKFSSAATANQCLEATARVTGRMGGLHKVEGQVTADGRLVAAGSITLAEAR
jgi:3-hydroxyacyl-[acyl-carrier-protein] dehydratase